MSELASSSSPFRLSVAFSIARLATPDFDVVGRENLALIDPSEQLIVATSHHTDIDIPWTGRALSRDMNLGVVDLSTSHELTRRYAFEYLYTKAIGVKNFFPIDFVSLGWGHEIAAPFNPDNFDPMIEAMKSGKRITMPAYSPYKNRVDKAIKPGIGVPYLAAMTDARVLPVTIKRYGTQGLGQSENMLRTLTGKEWLGSAVIAGIGEPLQLPEIPNIQALADIIRGWRGGKKFSPAEHTEIRSIKRVLTNQGHYLVSALDALDEKFEL